MSASDDGPGVGPVVALTYRATVNLPIRLRKSKAVGAVFGLTPSKYQSGEIDCTGHQPNDKPRDVVLRHEVPHIRRQKQRLIGIPGAKVLAHSASLNRTPWGLNSDYSDRLIA